MYQLKNPKCDQTQNVTKLNMWQNSKLYKWQNLKKCDKTIKKNSKYDRTQTQNVAKLKNWKCDKTQN